MRDPNRYLRAIVTDASLFIMFIAQLRCNGYVLVISPFVNMIVNKGVM